jgi:hypothetical protein
VCEGWEGIQPDSEGDLGDYQVEVVTTILEALAQDQDSRRTRKLVSNLGYYIIIQGLNIEY